MKRASKDQDIINIFKEMESFQEQYPEDLMAARRASFLEQVEQASLENEEQLALQDQDFLAQLKSLSSAPAPYPSRLLATRRASFVRRIVWLNFVSTCTAAWLAIKTRIPEFTLRKPSSPSVPASLLAAGLALALFFGYVFFGKQAALSPVSPVQYGTVHSGEILASDTREVSIVCKPGLQPPLCLAGEYKGDEGLTFQRNGSAQPAVAKDTMPRAGGHYKASYVNDGLYGPGASWISNSKNSWIKIDLGKATKLNTVTFGRDRLGKLSGHDPGQFVVALALFDDVYANGNNSNDHKEYEPVFNSKQAGFSGTISGAETVTAQFAPRTARFIKITFENKGVAIDEVEAFLREPSFASSTPPTKARDKRSSDSPAPVATSTSAPSFTSTPLPSDTVTPRPTATLVPSETATPKPTATQIPTNTPVPTSTFVPTSTAVPTNTPTSVPSDTPPPPTDTQVPPDTITPAPTLLPTATDEQIGVDYLDLIFRESVLDNP